MSEFLPEDFVERERKRVFEPDASFPRRVVAQISPVRRSEAGVWELVPGFARSMLLTAMLLIIGALAWQIGFPPPPRQSVIDAYLVADSTPAEAWLYGDAEIPEGQALLLEISSIE